MTHEAQPSLGDQAAAYDMVIVPRGGEVDRGEEIKAALARLSVLETENEQLRLQLQVGLKPLGVSERVVGAIAPFLASMSKKPLVSATQPSPDDKPFVTRVRGQDVEEAAIKAPRDAKERELEREVSTLKERVAYLEKELADALLQTKTSERVTSEMSVQIRNASDALESIADSLGLEGDKIELTEILASVKDGASRLGSLRTVNADLLVENARLRDAIDKTLHVRVLSIVRDGARTVAGFVEAAVSSVKEIVK